MTIYKIAIQESSLYNAFKNLKTQCAPGIDGIIYINCTKQLENSISKLHKDLKSHKYKPNPIKVIYMPRPNGGKKPFSISSVKDKIVQSTFKKELETLYEPVFHDSSFGFRPKLSCHSALKQIKKKWQAIKWIISLDISKCFNKIQHEILINVLRKRMVDQETIDLIKKLLNANYIDIHDFTKHEESKINGTPYHTIISVRCEIYYLCIIKVTILLKWFKQFTKFARLLLLKNKHERPTNSKIKKVSTT